jgi:hypothetical protein
MSNYTDFFLSANRNAVQLELLEISHPSFSQTFFKVRNARNGITVTLENNTVKTFDFLPMKIISNGNKNDLDNGVSVTFADNSDILPKELDRVLQASNFKTKPVCKYRVYSSTNLLAPLLGPLTYVIKTLTRNREGATFSAAAPQLNNSATGLLYTFERFPMLRGAL